MDKDQKRYHCVLAVVNARHAESGTLPERCSTTSETVPLDQGKKRYHCVLAVVIARHAESETLTEAALAGARELLGE